MRRFRRSFAGSRRKGTREQLHWFRGEASFFSADAFQTANAVVIFDPSTETPSVSDEVLTVRRIVLEAFPTWTFSVAAVQGIIFGIGVYIDSIQAGTAGPLVRDPLLGAASDQREDWLYLARTNLNIAGGAQVIAPSSVAMDGLRIGSRPWNCPDIRAARKLNQDDRLMLSWNAKRLDAATFAAPTQTRQGCTFDVSVLWQRTRR